jgi:hypothetical protein
MTYRDEDWWDAREEAIAQERMDAADDYDAECKAQEVISDETIVEFEGESVQWGILTFQDRKAYLAGGYPF